MPSVWDENPDLTPRLRDLAAKNVSAGGISRQLKISRNAVIGRCDRLGIVLNGKGPNRKIRSRKQPPPVHPDGYQEPSPVRRFSWQDAPA